MKIRGVKRAVTNVDKFGGVVSILDVEELSYLMTKSELKEAIRIFQVRLGSLGESE